MAQTTSGVRALLSRPAVYDALQRAMGAHAVRQEFAASVVRANAGMRVLDIGCGTGDLLAYLPEAIEYVGFDVSDEYIAAARRRFGGRGRFLCGVFDATAAGSLGPVDVAIASGLLHHLDDAPAVALLRDVAGVLAAGGRFVSIDPVLAAGQHPIARLLIRADRGRNVRQAAGYAALAASVFAHVDGVVRHRRWPPYTHWTMWASHAAPGGNAADHRTS